MKLCFIDTETTGLYPYTSAVIEVGGIIRINGRIKEKFNIKMKPHEGASIKVNAAKADANTTSQKDGFDQFTTTLEKYVNKFNPKDKFFFVAYNAPFDENMMRAWFKRNGNNYYGSYFWNPGTCVMQMAMRDLLFKNKRDQIENMKLGTVAKFYGVKVDDSKLHSALYDSEVTKNLWNKINTSKRRKRKK